MAPPIKPAANRDISAAQGALITTKAQDWKGTPYVSIGAASTVGVSGDCSGSTWRIYVAAGFSYDYQMTSNFAAYVTTSKKFRELGANEPRQDGDILLWPGHMAIAATFANDPADATTARKNASGHAWTQTNDMWSATKPGGPPYGPNYSPYFQPGVTPRVFRYQQ